VRLTMLDAGETAASADNFPQLAALSKPRRTLHKPLQRLVIPTTILDSAQAQLEV
jgi:hypothetical protein